MSKIKCRILYNIYARRKERQGNQKTRIETFAPDRRPDHPKPPYPMRVRESPLRVPPPTRFALGQSPITRHPAQPAPAQGRSLARSSTLDKNFFAHPERFDTRTMHGGQGSILCIVLCIARRCSALRFRVQNPENKKYVCPFIYWAKRTFSSGGDKGSRTPDLLNAIETLYQLSYIPKWRKRRILSHIRRRKSIGFRFWSLPIFCALPAGG